MDPDLDGISLLLLADDALLELANRRKLHEAVREG
jgi:hypothetical protein